MNLPNILAISRIISAPLLFFLLLLIKGQDDLVFISWLNYFAALLFVISSVTDFFDGYIARKWNQITKLGAIIDPLADKMITLAAFLGLMIIDRANPWAVYLILVREFLITGFRSIIATQNVNLAARFSGKIKTVSQMIAIGFLCMQWMGGEILLWISVFFSLYSGFEYIYSYYKTSKK